ncbi:hypothetical protein LOTGIDRAFT_163231 [Lottia gigantea]|uniref:DNA-directed DNA polymerase n=1 Tax=Lottia gigantea TaxID=225164 RepID=V4AA03_LOTGI|nr:hypothetical protein LOTGIDRAFT_163231 [Lottia gigantea]ESO91870.1 hypothetical protein LOTGIDRAFT_163231 [Lottia gigantea]
MISARINEFNKKCDITFQIYTHNNRNLRPTIVKEELDWVLYLHNSHFCLIRRNKKSLGIKEIEDNYEQVWKTCGDDNAVTQVSPLKQNVFSSINDAGLFAWDFETYSESETRKAIPYASRGILSLPLSNPYTDEDLQKKWKKQKEITSNNNYLQHINFTCSYQHETSSLAAWGNSSNLPMNLRKITDIDIAKYTKDNWESLRHEWEPYAKRDTLCLGSCLIKYNQVTKEVVNQNMSNNLTAPSLSFKGWYYLYHYDKEMVEEEWYETTRMVAKHTEKENIEKVYSHTNPFIRHYIRRSIKGGRVSANRKIFETNKMDEICNVLKEFISQSETPSETESISQSDNSQSETPSETESISQSDNSQSETPSETESISQSETPSDNSQSETRSDNSRRDNIINLFKEYSASTKDKTEVNSKLKKIKCTKLMAFDANGLYASAMSDLDSEYPKAESARPFLPEEERKFLKL